MRVMSKFKKGQSTLEYAILIIIIIAVLLTISTYVKRGIQGRAVTSADDIGGQYDPGNVNYYRHKTTSSESRQVMAAGTSTTTLTGDEITNDLISLNIANTRAGYYGGPV